MTLYWNGQQQVQQVTGGYRVRRAERSAAPLRVGKDPKIEKAIIRWPSGKVQTIENLVPGKFYNVKEAE